jgi:cell division septation protein DedD
MRRAHLLLLATILAQLVSAQDQSTDIAAYLARVEKGEADAVRGELPSLLSKYPNNPGVLYLQGVLTADGTEAVRIYQSVVDNFPRNEWADDALFKVYQFYYALGLYRTAEIKLNQLKADYPESRYLGDASQADVKSMPDEEGPGLPKATQETVVHNPTIQAPTEKPALPETEPSNPATEETSRGQYTLQVGAFSQQVNAEKQKLFFEDLGYSVEVINKVRDSRSLFVVLVGDYKTSDEAKQVGTEVKKKYNITSMVVTR